MNEINLRDSGRSSRLCDCYLVGILYNSTILPNAVHKRVNICSFSSQFHAFTSRPEKIPG